MLEYPVPADDIWLATREEIAECACRFMTICKVREPWRNRIPAVVHVDQTARPQVITRELNPLYYDIVAAHGRLTGIPVLVNTSFNVHEEPIVNAPEECVRALVEGRIDFVATRQAVYERFRSDGFATAAVS